MADAIAREASDDIVYPSAIPFALIHLGCLAAIWTGITPASLMLCAALYWLRMFAVTAGYHRYFSHRSFVTNRAWQLVLAALAQSTAQKSVIWWAAKHRHHHRHSDTKQDVHSPRHAGFLFSHVGWLFARAHDAVSPTEVPDLARFPELVWLHRFELVPAALLAVACLLVAGWPGLVVGFLWSTVLVYHATFCINSLAHVRGAKRYVTGDDSRNNPVLALLTMGEGWHNNHHAFPSSARQGFRWWELDASWYLLRLLAGLRVVSDLKSPSARVLRNEHPLGPRIIQRTAEQLSARFDPRQIAGAIAAALHPPELARLRCALLTAQGRAGELFTGWSAPYIPSQADLAWHAHKMFAATPSLDAIVEQAHGLLVAAIGRHLAAPITCCAARR